MYDIYISEKNDQWRFALGKRGKKPLYIIGLNPSTATINKPDATATRVERIAAMQGFDGFVMLNLYPARSKNPRTLPAMADALATSSNLEHINQIVSKSPNPSIWAAWGNNIHSREYFGTTALDLIRLLAPHPIEWLHLGPLTKAGHPRHPSRSQYAWKLQPLDLDQYKNRLENHLNVHSM